MAENYEILLGVKLDTSDIKDQISDVSKNIKPIELKIDAETKELTNTIKEALNSLSKGTKNVLTLDTSKIEASLDKLSGVIADIRTSLGTLDSKSGMKNLVSSINQMVTALGKAENESDSLVKSLSALSKKDFSVNIGLKLGGGNVTSRNADYGIKVRQEVLPELTKQFESISNAITKHYQKIYADVAKENARLSKNSLQRKKVISSIPDALSDVLTKSGYNIDSYDVADIIKKINTPLKKGESLSPRIAELQKFINLMTEAAKMQGINLDSVISGFSKSADEWVKDAENVRNGTNELKESSQELKSFLGSGIEGEKLSAQLDEIVANLNKIKTAIQGLSQNNAIDGLTQSFNKLSETLDKLMTNAKLVQDVLGSVGGSANAGMSNQAKQAQETTKAFKEAAQEAKKLDNISIDISDGNIDDIKNALKNLKVDDSNIEEAISKLNEMNIVAEKVSGTLKDGDIAKFDIKGIQSMEDGLKRVATITKTISNDGWTEKYSQSFDKAAESIQRLKKEAETANKIRIDIETEKFENQVDQLKTQLNQLADKDGSLKMLRDSIKEVENAYEAMKIAAKSDNNEALIQAQKEYAVAVQKTTNELKIQAREQKTANANAMLESSRKALQTDMLNWLKKNSKATKEYKAEIDRLIVSLDKLDQAGVNGVRRRFSNIDKEADLKGLKGLNFLDSIKSKIKEYSVYFGTAELFMYAEQGLRSMFEQVKLIDTAMTELKKVTNETDAAYNKFLTNAADRAKAIGTTIDGLVSSTADFARLGYGFEDAQGLAEVANIYAVVGDEIDSVESATESLISTMAAFKGEMNGMSNTDFAMSIIDKFNEIGNNFAISSGGIGEALERSASSLMAANNTIDESIALITAANTVVDLCNLI